MAQIDIVCIHSCPLLSATLLPGAFIARLNNVSKPKYVHGSYKSLYRSVCTEAYPSEMYYRSRVFRLIVAFVALR